MIRTAAILPCLFEGCDRDIIKARSMFPALSRRMDSIGCAGFSLHVRAPITKREGRLRCQTMADSLAIRTDRKLKTS